MNLEVRRINPSSGAVSFMGGTTDNELQRVLSWVRKLPEVNRAHAMTRIEGIPPGFIFQVWESADYEQVADRIAAFSS